MAALPVLRFTEEAPYTDEVHLIAWIGAEDVGSVPFLPGGVPPGAEEDDARDLVIYNLTVHECHRRRRIALALLDELMRRYPAPVLRLDQGTRIAHTVVRTWLTGHGLPVPVVERSDTPYDVAAVAARVATPPHNVRSLRR